jgi:hypothetical protein
MKRNVHGCLNSCKGRGKSHLVAAKRTDQGIDLQYTYPHICLKSKSFCVRYPSHGHMLLNFGASIFRLKTEQVLYHVAHHYILHLGLSDVSNASRLSH